MTRYVVVRVWLADRPGSLGEVATKIGEVGGDLVGVDILERNGARAVDELTVELTDGCSAESLAEALSQLCGVEVEDLRHLVSRVPLYWARSARCGGAPGRVDRRDRVVECARPRCLRRLCVRLVHRPRPGARWGDRTD